MKDTRRRVAGLWQNDKLTYLFVLPKFPLLFPLRVKACGVFHLQSFPGSSSCRIIPLMIILHFFIRTFERFFYLFPEKPPDSAAGGFFWCIFVLGFSWMYLSFSHCHFHRNMIYCRTEENFYIVTRVACGETIGSDVNLPVTHSRF